MDPSPDTTMPGNGEDEALLRLLALLKAGNYRFVTPTPATHARVLVRPTRREARDLRDVLGWSLPFDPDLLDAELTATLRAAGALFGDGRLRSRYRVSSLGDELFLHSAYPTTAEDAVFFGPDSYRFADLIRRELGTPAADAYLVDIGAGAGVGGIVAAKLCPTLRITLTDINPSALRLARINAIAAGVEVNAALGAELDPVDGPVDIALANPPYIIDTAGRAYRDGGDMHGARAAYDMAAAAIERLSPGGRFILYTGSPIIDGEDRLCSRLTELAERTGCVLRYEEIDPDMFGEELAKPAYAEVERIAIVSAVIAKGN